MQLSEGMPLGPSVCFICQSSPPESAIVDTLMTFHPPAPSPLDGRKYLCEHCVGTAARLLGWASPAEKASAEYAIEAVSAHRDSLEQELTARGGFVEALEALKPYLDAKKPAAKKAE